MERGNTMKIIANQTRSLEGLIMRHIKMWRDKAIIKVPVPKYNTKGLIMMTKLF